MNCGHGHTDPVCGKEVDASRSEAMEYKQKKYFFCSTQCRERFEQQTERVRLGELAKMGALFANAKVRWGVA